MQRFEDIVFFIVVLFFLLAFVGIWFYTKSLGKGYFLYK